jgi:hypothetical protein
VRSKAGQHFLARQLWSLTPASITPLVARSWAHCWHTGWWSASIRGATLRPGSAKYHNQTIHGPLRQSQRFSTLTQQPGPGPRAARAGHHDQPVPRPVAGNRGQTATPDEDLPRLRIAPAALHSPRRWHAADRRRRADGCAETLLADVRARTVGWDHQVHETLKAQYRGCFGRKAGRVLGHLGVSRPGGYGFIFETSIQRYK